MLARVFVPALGFDDIVRINVVDGVRVTFKSGDVAHVRPSGNAPQLRIYANSDSQARADRIVADGLREPDGILRRLVSSCAPPES
jgi:phosphomannomutase